MILNITPENTWNPWNPVIKKKKSANNGVPYSLCFKFAPSTILFPSLFNLTIDSALDRTIRLPFLSKYWVRINSDSSAKNPFVTSAKLTLVSGVSE
mgnify:CR=1 FL=1